MRKIFILLLPIALAVGCTSQDKSEDTEGVNTYNHDANNAEEEKADGKAPGESKENGVEVKKRTSGAWSANGNASSSDFDLDEHDDEKEENDEETYAAMLDELEEDLASLEEKAEEGTKEERREAVDELYERWDVALNEIYDALENELSDKAMDDLHDEQQDWIEDREEYGEEEASEYDGDMSHSFAETQAEKEYTKERCYELVDEYLE